MATKLPPLYRTWANLKNRCANPNNPAYKDYGGRGITVCKRWLDSYENFVADMGERPEGMTLDRINNDGNYEPSNCRWATPIEQSRNTRKNRYFTINGVTKSLAVWIESSEINGSTIRQRLYAYGWSIEDSLFKPLERIRQ